MKFILVFTEISRNFGFFDCVELIFNELLRLVLPSFT